MDKIKEIQEPLNNTPYLLSEQDDIFYGEDYEYKEGQKIYEEKKNIAFKNVFKIDDDIEDVKYLSDSIHLFDRFLDEKIATFLNKSFGTIMDLNRNLEILDIFTIKLIHPNKFTIEDIVLMNKFSRIIFNEQSNIVNYLSDNVTSIKFLNNMYPEHCKQDKKNKWNSTHYTTNNTTNVPYNQDNIEIKQFPKYLAILELNEHFNNKLDLPKHLKKLWILNEQYEHDVYLPKKIKEFICSSTQEYEIFSNINDKWISKFPENIEKIVYGGKINNKIDLTQLTELHYFGKSSLDIECIKLKELHLTVTKDNQKININKTHKDCILYLICDNKNLKNIMINTKIKSIIIHPINEPNKKECHNIKIIDNLLITENLMKTFINTNVTTLSISECNTKNKNILHYLTSKVETLEIGANNILTNNNYINIHYTYSHLLNNKNNAIYNLPNKITKLYTNKAINHRKFKLPYKLMYLLLNDKYHGSRYIPVNILNKIIDKRNKLRFENFDFDFDKTDAYKREEALDIISRINTTWERVCEDYVIYKKVIDSNESIEKILKNINNKDFDDNRDYYEAEDINKKIHRLCDRKAKEERKINSQINRILTATQEVKNIIESEEVLYKQKINRITRNNNLGRITGGELLEKDKSESEYMIDTIAMYIDNIDFMKVMLKLKKNNRSKINIIRTFESHEKKILPPTVGSKHFEFILNKSEEYEREIKDFKRFTETKNDNLYNLNAIEDKNKKRFENKANEVLSLIPNNDYSQNNIVNLIDKKKLDDNCTIS